MLIFPLKKEWYEKIKSGKKTIDYREVKDYWTNRLFNYYKTLGVGEDRICYFQLGYKPDTRLKAKIIRIFKVSGKESDLRIDKEVYAIHFKLCKE